MATFPYFLLLTVLSHNALVHSTDSETVDIPGCEKSCILLDKNELICEHCDCNLLPTADNDDADSMREIHFADNSLTNITYMGTFYLLKYLDVSSNHIAYIEEAAFSSLHHLEKLNLERNRISSIKEEHFKGLTSLKVLFLGLNQLTHLTANVFRTNLRGLQTLSLRENMLQTMDHNAFTDLPSLQYLHLEGNLIDIIEANHFLGLDQLEELRLSDNDLFIVPSKAFYECSKLRILDLGANWINKIEKDAFMGLDNVKNIQLSINKLQNITKGMFDGLSSIEALYLSKNPIKVIQPGSFPPTLRKIHLNYMDKLARIRNGSFTNLKNLEEIEVTNSKKLVFIEPGAFAYNGTTSSVTILNLYNSSLMTLSESMLDWERMDSLVLGQNEWVCDCNLLWIKVNENIDEEIKKQVVCSHPHHVKGLNLLELDENQFSCSFFNTHRYSLEVTILIFVTLMFVLVAAWFIYRFRHVLCPCCFVMPGKYSTLYNAMNENADDDEAVKLTFEENSPQPSKAGKGVNNYTDREQIVPGPTSV